LLGKDVHFTILSHAKEILKIVKTIATTVELHNLEKIEDSVQLCAMMFRLRKMTQIIPHRLTYPDPKDPSARKPTKVQAAPVD
jgi:hypothetical protein